MRFIPAVSLVQVQSPLPYFRPDDIRSSGFFFYDVYIALLHEKNASGETFLTMVISLKLIPYFEPCVEFDFITFTSRETVFRLKFI